MTIDEFVKHEIARALDANPGPDRLARELVSDRAAQVLRPAGALERLDETAVWLAGWHQISSSELTAHCLIFAADHGVVAAGVSAYPQEVTGAMKASIERGIATSTALARANGAELTLVDVGVGLPTNDLTSMDALDENRFRHAWNAGVDAVGQQTADILILGELGIGNTTAAAAVAAGIIGGSGADWVGRGTGVDDAGLARKAAAVDAGLKRLGERRSRPAQVLVSVGGAELVAIAGAAVEARRRSQPLLLDGFIATAALLPLEAIVPGFLDHALAGHRSGEQGHIRMLDWLGKEPLLELNMRLGEASGALVALPLLRSAVAGVLDVATFAEAGVPGPGS